MFGRPEYVEIEHTADVGIELSAPDLRAALERAAAAMFDVICDLDSVEAVTSLSVEVTAREGDLGNLLVRWLTELLYLHQSRGLLLRSFSIRAIGAGSLKAEVAGEKLDPRRHSLRADLKAPTYHELEIQERDGRWHVRVIFDV
jgi:SHS2 domain-containing protein